MLVKIVLIISGFFALTTLAKAPPRFVAETIDDKIAIGYGLAIGDVDGDGKPDILLADKKQFAWYRNGDWKRFVMIDSLTEQDNVCIAARDLDGDGKVEVAVGAQWNPGETSDSAQSGSVHYLLRPADPTQLWKALQLHHEPTVHRMQWVKQPGGGYGLLVLPLHGRGNKGGEGLGVKFLLYRYPANVHDQWQIDTLEKSMHLTHNFEVVEESSHTLVYLGGKEGIRAIDLGSGEVKSIVSGSKGTGELRIGKTKADGSFIAAIEPMHGSELAVYEAPQWQRVLVEDDLKEGHALAVADVLQIGRPQIIAGWRNPNREGKVGIRLYTAKDRQRTRWEGSWIDENGMACEDLKVADLNGDGKPEIIAAGRSTHNLKIYWNR